MKSEKDFALFIILISFIFLEWAFDTVEAPTAPWVASAIVIVASAALAVACYKFFNGGEKGEGD